MEHTPTAWRVGREGTVVADHPVPEITGSDMVDYYGGHLIAESLAGRNARRIVACVNACKGLSTDELERFGLASAFGTEMLEIEKQRDQLAEALKELRDAVLDGVDGFPNEILIKACAALAAVKGE